MKSIASNKVISLFPNRLEIAKQIYLISSVKVNLIKITYIIHYLNLFR